MTDDRYKVLHNEAKIALRDFVAISVAMYMNQLVAELALKYRELKTTSNGADTTAMIAIDTIGGALNKVIEQLHSPMPELPEVH